MDSRDLAAEKSGIEDEVEAVYRFYAALGREMDADAGLGGKLLYIGEADEAGCRLARAANIAGAASLVASGDAAGLRQAMREGAIDFVVTTLDEALRILKNEVRKREAVAVGVSAGPQALERAMVERGVQPDLLAMDLAHGAEIEVLEARGARRIAWPAIDANKGFQIFPIAPEWAQRTAAFDALLLERLAPEDYLNRRWVRRAPRYLAARTRRVRGLDVDAKTALDFSLLTGSGPDSD